MNENIIAIFVGDKGAGTTTLTESLLGQRNKDTPPPVSTAGVIYHNPVIGDAQLEIVEIPKSMSNKTRAIGRATKGNTFYIVLDATKLLPDAETFKKDWLSLRPRPDLQVNVIFNKIDLLSEAQKNLFEANVNTLLNHPTLEGIIPTKNIFYCSSFDTDSLIPLMQHIVSDPDVKKETSRSTNIFKNLWRTLSNFVSHNPVRSGGLAVLLVATIVLVILSIIFPPAFAIIPVVTSSITAAQAAALTSFVIGGFGVIAMLLWNTVCDKANYWRKRFSEVSKPAIEIDPELRRKVDANDRAALYTIGFTLGEKPRELRTVEKNHYDDVLQKARKAKAIDTTQPTTKPDLSPLMVYEIKPDPSAPWLNVKLVVWSNVQALGEIFLKSPEFKAQLGRIQQEQEPDAILLDNFDYDSANEVNLQFRGYIIQAGGNQPGNSVFIYKRDYHLSVSDKDIRGSEIKEGAYARDDTASPLSFRWICSQIVPDTGDRKADTRQKLIEELHSKSPTHLYATPPAGRPERTGDHAIIILPKLVESIEKGDNECEVFYKSFKMGKEEKITGQPLDPTTGKVLGVGISLTNS